MSSFFHKRNALNEVQALHDRAERIGTLALRQRRRRPASMIAEHQSYDECFVHDHH